MEEETADITPEELVARFGSVTETARRLGLSRQSIYNWLQQGHISRLQLDRVRWIMQVDDGD